MEQSLQEKQELDKLEKAAEDSSEPEQIQQRAASPHLEPAEKVPPFWFVPYLVAAAICGVLLLLLVWNPNLFSASLAAKIQRYLVGGLAIAAILAVGRGIEVYVIARVHNAAARFN